MQNDPKREAQPSPKTSQNCPKRRPHSGLILVILEALWTHVVHQEVSKDIFEDFGSHFWDPLGSILEISLVRCFIFFRDSPRGSALFLLKVHPNGTKAALCQPYCAALRSPRGSALFLLKVHPNGTYTTSNGWRPLSVNHNPQHPAPPHPTPVDCNPTAYGVWEIDFLKGSRNTHTHKNV